jgi:hypothetical protein
MGSNVANCKLAPNATFVYEYQSGSEKCGKDKMASPDTSRNRNAPLLHCGRKDSLAADIETGGRKLSG